MPRSRRLILGSCAALLIAIAVAVVTTLTLRARHVDRSNYTIHPELTPRLTALFDSLGIKPDQLNLGGGTNGTAVGSNGIGSATQFVIKDGPEMLGVHLLGDRDRTTIRFSLPPKGESPFHTTELSASPAEDPQLQHSFDALLQRLEKIDPLRSQSLFLLVEEVGKSR